MQHMELVDYVLNLLKEKAIDRKIGKMGQIGKRGKSFKQKQKELEQMNKVSYFFGAKIKIPLDWEKKNYVRSHTRALVKKGIIKKLPCMVCKEEKSEIHHRSYEVLDDIIWLCKSCHHAEHKKLRKEAKND